MSSILGPFLQWTERNPDKIRKIVRLPKYEKWGGYKQWIEMNVERINFYYHMGK